MKCKRIADTRDMPRDQWLKLRKGGIGGSDIGAIMGLSSWCSPFEVFIDKTTDRQKDLSDNESVYWGTVLEDVIAKEFERRTGKRVAKLNALLQSEETPFAYADIDRRIVGEDAGLECKSTNAYSADQWTNDEVPQLYICQCQWYMYVTGAQKWYIACLIGGQKYVHKAIERDDELIGYMLELGTAFWKNHVEKNIAPPVDGSKGCTEMLGELYPTDNGETVMLTSDYVTLADNLVRIKEQEKKLKNQKSDIENRIKSYLGDAQKGVCDKYTITWKTQRGPSKLDKDALSDAIGPTYLSEFYQTTTVRRFNIKIN